MPFIMYNKSKCPLCGKVMSKTDHLVAFNPFIGNSNDPLHIFNDAILHDDCAKSHPLYPLLAKRYSEFLKINIPARERPCDHCHKILTIDEVIKDDIFGIPYISYGNSELEKFDYLYLHRHCISKYKYIHKLYEGLYKIKNEGCWGGDVLDRLILIIEKNIR